MLFKRILIAVDGSEVSADAGRVGLELAAALDAEVGLIHVIRPAISAGAWYAVSSPELKQPVPELTADIFSSLHAKTPIPKGSPTFLPLGEPVAAIVEAAREWSASLVVVGSHGRNWLDRVMLGSVAEGVSRHAPCPVMVVRNLLQA
ncbi:universal stress protein [Methylobacterium sp. BTF04]|uniref:universal stress protein n=1 Tax=Methylobacterium sp. BTF04 TaxID=2708300 RepID=UPI0013D502C0|nr:universal stress protein [Methylobacterium sp. BTF04]NEU14907.1 universal stress protein [Methylobacterium sp. BTF04]